MKIGTNDADSDEDEHGDNFKDFSANTGPDVMFML